MTRFVACIVILLGMQMAAMAANISGKWTFDVQLDAGSGTPSFVFEQAGEKLSGKYQGQFGEEKITGSVKGNAVKFTFRLSQGGEGIDVTYEGTIEADGTMKGKASYGTMASGTWTAKKLS
ncbi:MAG: hypothetical protein JNL98_18005 [Bryobacterales bacterium]|nr:hypothetical protein [Bryobacterales bacterium]